MLASDVITSVRRILNDENAGAYRWPTPTLLRYLSEAQFKIYRWRPDLFLDSSSEIVEPSNITSAGTTISLAERWREAIANIVAGKALQEDSDDTINQNRARYFGVLGREELRASAPQRNE